MCQKGHHPTHIKEDKKKKKRMYTKKLKSKLSEIPIRNAETFWLKQNVSCDMQVNKLHEFKKFYGL